MASCSYGGCASYTHTIGCRDGIANGFTCRVRSLMPCTPWGWRCTRWGFFCSTSSPILPCTLSDEQTPTDSILPAAEQHKQQASAMTAQERQTSPRKLTAC